ncbi:MAG: prolyl oligopeptidase family serine peptidase, partial [Pseudomonadota bacterium]
TLPFRNMFAINADGTDQLTLYEFPTRMSWNDKTLYRVSQDNVLSTLPGEDEYVLTASVNRKIEMCTYRLNIYTAKRQKRQCIDHDGEYTSTGYLVDSEGNLRGVSNRNRDDIELLVRQDGKSEWKQLPIFGELSRKRIQAEAFSDDPNKIYVRSRHATGRFAIYTYDITNEAFANLVFGHDQYDVEGLIWHPADYRPIAVSYIADRRRFHFLDEDYERLHRRLMATFPDRTIDILSSSADLAKHIVMVTGPESPGDVYYYDARKPIVALIYSKNPDLPREHLAPMDVFKVKARDGVEFTTYVTKPKSGTAPFPTVILPHRSPFERDVLAFDAWAQFLVSRGYAVIQPNYRGSPGYGASFEDLGVGQWGRAVQNDILDAHAFAVREGIAASDRICILGESLAGHAALLAVAREPDMFACAIAIAGIGDFNRFLSTDNPYKSWRWTREAFVGDMERDAVSQISPISYVDSWSRPTLLFHAENDLMVSPKQTERLYRKLRRSKVDVRYVSIGDDQRQLRTSGTKHKVLSPEAHMKMFAEAEAFLTRHLAPQSGS